LSDDLKLVYEGPLLIVFEEGVYGSLELGGDRWADNAAERLHDLLDGPRTDGFRDGMALSKVRVEIEVIERDPPPPDPVVDFEGPPAPELR
jgi:hypothetical protein